MKIVTKEIRIVALVKEYDYEDRAITAQTRLIEDLGFDSLDMVEIAMAIEDEYEIELSDDDVYGAVTVQDLLNAATRLTGA
jgi:acyl carrier protein